MGPLDRDQISTSDYARLEAEDTGAPEWSLLEAGMRGLKEATGTLPEDRSQTNLHAHKDEWVRHHAATIKAVARKHGIPPELLAGVAWTEAGGSPELEDHGAHLVRGWGGLGGKPEETSFGEVQIQLRHVAEQLGLDPESARDRHIAIAYISDPTRNLDAVGKHIGEFVQRRLPGREASRIGTAHGLREYDVQRIGYFYNYGDRDGVAAGRSAERMSKESGGRYGHDLWSKMEEMRQLLK